MEKKLTIIITILIIAVVTATAVLFLFPYQPDQPPQTDDSGSTKLGIQEVVNANNQFAFDFYSEITKKEKGNIFYSPYSISSAVAMTYEGAKGQTAEEMKSVFHFPETDILRPNFAAIYNNINKNNKNYKLSTGNALWAQQDYQLLENYLSTVESYYGGKAANLDFVNENETSRQTINTFIEEQTNNKIKDLIPQGALSTDTRLVLTNAIYFKGTWVKQFDKENTHEQDFTTNLGEKVKTPMMKLTGDDAEFAYTETDEIQILEMPYDGKDLSMLLILPKENNLESVEESINSEKVAEWRDSLIEQRVDVYIPKFKFKTTYFMVENLRNMGMPTAFTREADFSGMDGTNNLFIQNVIHQAFVEVNEEGTEAAAATAAIIGTVSIPDIELFRANHPFIFIIQEKETGNILFLGRVSDPTKQ